MKIIGYDTKKKRKATCDNCTAIIEYVKSEVESRTYREYDGSSGGHEFIKCPNCKKEITLKAW